ncbi:MAG TPA: FHA domain-containing protein [Gemmatimonadales bacterium]|nr:FHA domain-containing protein [Gemmatimonadales bacterium]
MMQLEVGGQRYSIAAGETVIGSGSDCGVPLGGAGVHARHAIVQGLADGSAAVRRGSAGAEILVNGIRQGDDPVPLLHGDTIQIGEHELLVVDPSRSGNTQLFDSSAFERFVPPVPVPAPGTAGATGGRLVCLTDGREYQIGAQGLVFGRDASSDVVVPGTEVSRRHAQIGLTEQGYVLVDLSTNGTFVNGTRVEGSQVLARADVIRIGGDEFRFYADPVPDRPTAEPAAAAAALGSAEEPARPPTGAHQRLFNTMHGMPGIGGPPPAAPAGPVTPVAMAGAPIASLLVRSGTLKGKRLTVRVPVVNIGRGESNDLVIPEPSVSATHAKLQRREGIWVLSDLGSTNGTFVDGERISEETPLGPGATIRFGEVATLFESTDDVTGIQPRVGTDSMEGLPPTDEPAEPARPARRSGSAPRRPPVSAPRRDSGFPTRALVALVVIVAAVAAYLLLR